MNGRRLLVVGLALGWAVSVEAAKPQAAWHAAMPAGWLVAVEAADLAVVEATIARLAKPWGVGAPSLSKGLSLRLPDVRLDAGPWRLVLASGAEGALAPLLYLPAADYDELCDALDADRAGEIAIAEVAGFDIALADRGAWVEASLLDSRPEKNDEDASEDRLVWNLEGDLRIGLSHRSLEFAAKSLRQRRRGQIDAGLGRLGPWRMPEQLIGYLDALAVYHPLFESIASWKAPLQIAMRSSDEGLEAEAATAGVAKPAADGEPVNFACEDEVIGSLALAGPLPPALVDLWIASMRCQPHLIEAAEFPQPQWDDYAEANRAFFERSRSLVTVLTVPPEGAPLATNQAMLLAWEGSTQEFGDSVRLATTRWNQLVDASAAPSPLRVQMAPLEKGRKGYRLTADLFKGFGLEPNPEVEAVFKRYYGSAVVGVDLERLEGGMWRMVCGESGPQLKSVAEPTRDSKAYLCGELRLDRLTAWQQRIIDADMADAVGHRSRPPMAEAPPATLSADFYEGVLRVVTTLPWATYEAAAAWGREPPVPKQAE